MKVYLSHNLPEKLDAKMLDVIEQTPGIDSINGNTFVFRDGSSAQVDSFIYCTGKARLVRFVHTPETKKKQKVVIKKKKK